MAAQANRRSEFSARSRETSRRSPSASSAAGVAIALRALREQAGLGVAGVVTRSGLARSTLYAAYQGDALPNWGTVERLVVACGGSVDGWLVRWEAVSSARTRRPPTGPSTPAGDGSGAPGDGTASEDEEPAAGTATGGTWAGTVTAAPGAPATAPAPRSAPGPTSTDDEVAAGGPRAAGSRRGRLRSRRFVVSLTVVTVGAVTTGVWAVQRGGTAPPEPAQSLLYARDDAVVPVRRCPSLSCAVAAEEPNGTAARMVCFRDAEQAELNYRSDRWFDVVVPRTSVSGWVHSSQVGRQTRVGLC